MKSLRPHAVAALVGVGIWYGIMGITGGREAWDSPLYWYFGYPAMVMTACAMSVFWPQRPWRWGAVMMASQAVFGLFVSPAGLNLWPLSLVVLMMLTLPLIGAASLGAWASCVRQPKAA